jgi:hypothetical protein
VLRAAGETETTQENIQDWLQLDDGDLGFQLLTEEEIAAVILFIYLHRHYILLNFQFISFFTFVIFYGSFASIIIQIIV